MEWLVHLCHWLRFGRSETPLGRQGETAAASYLRRKGYKIVARSSRERLGEIDLVAIHDKTVVFIEVKTRRSHHTGHPTEAVDTEKQRRLTRLALAYLKRHGLLDHPARFDVVAVTWPEGQRKPVLEHFLNAFPATGHDSMFS